jgi:hypothetical protein
VTVCPQAAATLTTTSRLFKAAACGAAAAAHILHRAQCPRSSSRAAVHALRFVC